MSFLPSPRSQRLAYPRESPISLCPLARARLTYLLPSPPPPPPPLPHFSSSPQATHGCPCVPLTSLYTLCSQSSTGLSLKDQLAQLQQPAPIGLCLPSPPVLMSLAPNSPDHQTSTPRMPSQESTLKNIDCPSITQLLQNTTLMSRESFPSPTSPLPSSLHPLQALRTT